MTRSWSLPRPLLATAASHVDRRTSTPPRALGTVAVGDPGDLDLRAAGWVAAAYWVVVFVLDVLNDGPIAALGLGPHPMSKALFDSSVWWSSWILATPALLLLFRRLAPRRLGWRRWAAAHVVFGGVLCVAHQWAAAWTFRQLDGSGLGVVDLALSFLGQFALPEVFAYWGLVCSVQLAAEARRARARDAERAALRQRAEFLEARHRWARLSALHRQLDSHFVLNALHGVGGLVRLGRGERAVTVLERIGTLVRTSSEAAEQPEVPLTRELEILQLYLGVEEARRDGAVSVRYDVDEAVREAAVPPFLLQPLVENALRHGKGPGAAHLAIRGRRVGASLRIEVQDRGGPPCGPLREGTGLWATRARLRLLHGGDADVALFGTGDGMTAEVTLPLRRNGAS